MRAIDVTDETPLARTRRARRIATLTHGLSREAAAHVDAQVAPVADSAGAARIERLVTS